MTTENKDKATMRPGKLFRVWLVAAALGLWWMGPNPLFAVEAGEGIPDVLQGIEVLDIGTAKQIAIEGSPTLAAAYERVYQAEERVRQARAAYWPSIDAGGSGARVEPSNNEVKSQLSSARRFDPSSRIDDSTDIYRSELTGGWALFTGFRRRFENARARFGELETRSALEEARRLLIFSVATSYYEAQLARENIAMAKADEAFNLRQASEAKSRRRAGSGSLSDVLNFEIQVNAARSDLNDAEREYELARIALAAVMGLPDAYLPESIDIAELPDETTVEMAEPEPVNLIAFAEYHRPDLMSSTLRIRQAETEIGIAKSEYYPTLTLEGAIDGEREDNLEFERDDYGNTIGLFLNINLFSGGATRARVAEARFLSREAERNFEAVRISVSSDVREAVATVRSSQRELILQRENAKLVQKNRELVEKGYAAGQESLVRLNEAQRDLIQAQGRLALSLVALKQQWERLDAATGGNLLLFAPPSEKVKIRP
jgi:outer membrane protein TolC